MKRGFSPRPYLQVFTLLLLIVSLPRTSSETLQGITIAMASPVWEQLSKLKRILAISSMQTTSEEGESVYAKEEINRLQLENRLLKNEIEKLHQILRQEFFIHTLAEDKKETLYPLFQLRTQERERILKLELESVPAQVLYRSSGSWSSTFWINVGEQENTFLGRIVVAKNSPVVQGCAVVGVVDYVGRRQSRVRLITDTELTPSVRAIRAVGGQTWYLGKGELRGSNQPEWRSRRLVLRGYGFNYDFADSEGPPRDLRTGISLEKSKELVTMPIVQDGDLLITTGMDGVFPPGLHAAKVANVHLLKEGDFCYELEAYPCCDSLDSLSFVSVLPPIGYDPSDSK